MNTLSKFHEILLVGTGIKMALYHGRREISRYFPVFGVILLLIKRGHIYIFIFVPVWQKNNMSLTPVSQVNCRNFGPKQHKFYLGLSVDKRLEHGQAWQNTTLEK